jgi:uncharacterized membrane protein
MNEEHNGWKEPKQIITDRQFVVVIVIAAILFTILLITKLHEQNKEDNKETSQRAYKCFHNS